MAPRPFAGTTPALTASVSRRKRHDLVERHCGRRVPLIPPPPPATRPPATRARRNVDRRQPVGVTVVVVRAFHHIRSFAIGDCTSSSWKGPSMLGRDRSVPGRCVGVGQCISHSSREASNAGGGEEIPTLSSAPFFVQARRLSAKTRPRSRPLQPQEWGSGTWCSTRFDLAYLTYDERPGGDMVSGSARIRRTNRDRPRPPAWAWARSASIFRRNAPAPRRRLRLIGQNESRSAAGRHRVRGLTCRKLDAFPAA